jgi:hypothetical protein
VNATSPARRGSTQRAPQVYRGGGGVLNGLVPGVLAGLPRELLYDSGDDGSATPNARQLDPNVLPGRTKITSTGPGITLAGGIG